MASSIRGKRKRRQMKQSIKHGSSAKPRHTSKTGRTGMVEAKRTPSSKNSGIKVSLPKEITPDWWLVKKV